MLYLNNIPIPVPASFSVRLEWVNPFCYFDKVPGNAALGIEIEVNEYTRAIFGNPERFEKYSKVSARKFPGFSIRKKGNLLEAGSLVITDASNETYSAWLQPEMGVMGEAQRDNFIPDLDWKNNVEFEDKEEYIPGTDQYAKVKIKNEHFWEGKGASGGVMIEYLDEDEHLRIREEIKNYLSDSFSENEEMINQYPIPEAEDNTARVISPYLFFPYFVKEILRINRFYIRSHPFNEIHGASNLLVYNNYNIFDPVPRGLNAVVPPEEGGTEEQEFPVFDRRRNTYTTVTREVIRGVDWTLINFSYADLVPRLSVNETLLSIQNYLNVCFFFNPDRSVEIIDREEVFDTEPFDLSEYQVSEWRKKELKKVSLKFVADYDKNDANFGDEFHDLSDRWKDFKEAVDTYEDLLWITASARRGTGQGDRTIGQLRYVRNENKIYEYKWTTLNREDANGTEEQFNVLAWEFVSSGPQYFVYRNGDEIEEIKTGISTLQMEDGVLTARQRGNVNSMRFLWSDFTFRLFYYLGEDVGHVDNNLEQASCNWEGPNGIFNRRWKKTARWYANRQELEAEFNLPLNVLAYIKRNFAKQLFRTKKGAFIIDKISVDVGMNTMGKTTLSVYKV